jgi:hypothetical protein
MEMILRKPVKNEVKVIICGDIIVNFMVDSSKKRQLEAMLASFNMSSVVTIPTRYGRNTSTAIDNIFLDEQQYDGYDVFTVSNGLSDYKAQLLVLNLSKPINIGNQILYKRMINNDNIFDFQINLSYENWESVLNNRYINTCFNAFINTFLRHFYSSFPLIQRCKYKPKSWIMTGFL